MFRIIAQMLSSQTRPKLALWIEQYARFGYAAKGAVYIVAGILSTQAALRLGGKAASSGGALEFIHDQPFGQLFLGIIAVGLSGYALWRIVQAILDPEQHKPKAQDIARRAGYFVNGLIYGGIAFSAFQGMTHTVQQNGQSQQATETVVARILDLPLGSVWIGLGGACLIALGGYYFYRAFHKTFRKSLNLKKVSPQSERWIIQISRFGIVSRGFVFMILGGSLLKAAHLSQPKQAQSSEGLFDILNQSAHGSLLLAITATGLIAYGFYMCAQAYYRRFDLKFDSHGS